MRVYGVVPTFLGSGLWFGILGSIILNPIFRLPEVSETMWEFPKIGDPSILP